jgi:hypothetical protein
LNVGNNVGIGNPYKAVAGREVDHLICQRFLPSSDHYFSFSTDQSAAERLKRLIEERYKAKVVTGRLHVAGRPHFARLETGPSTSTEATGETYALAMSRLALVLTA